MRIFLRPAVPAALVAAVAVATPCPAHAKLIALAPPAQRAVNADVVLVGKVAAVEKDVVEVPSPYPGATDKQRYKIGVVKVESVLIGGEKAKEIRVGVVRPPKPDPKLQPPGRPIRPGLRGPAADLKEGQDLALFLVKHPKADFYILSGGNQPLDLATDRDGKQLESVKKVAAALADPAKGLKSDKPEVRAETAAVVVSKYRSYPVLGGEVEQVAVPAEESRALLKALAEGDWGTNNPRRDGPPSPLQAFQQLGLTLKDGWVQPVIVNQPGAPPLDYGAVQKDAFTKWLEGPGKNYQIKKNVAKPQK
jgi:hypothetical protein